jgi:hypothetical protein
MPYALRLFLCMCARKVTYLGRADRVLKQLNSCIKISCIAALVNPVSCCSYSVITADLCSCLFSLLSFGMESSALYCQCYVQVLFYCHTTRHVKYILARAYNNANVSIHSLHSLTHRLTDSLMTFSTQPSTPTPQPHFCTHAWFQGCE